MINESQRYGQNAQKIEPADIDSILVMYYTTNDNNIDYYNNSYYNNNDDDKKRTEEGALTNEIVEDTIQLPLPQP